MTDADFEPELGEWRWADDSWMPYSYNITNFGIGWGLYYTFVHFKAMEWLSCLIVVLLQTGWQIMCALVPDEGIDASPYIGGDGFSYNNLSYGSLGVLLALILDLIVPPHIRSTSGSSSTGGSAIDDFNLMHLNAHNTYRALHGVDPLEFDATIAEGSKEWSEYLDNTVGSLQHSSGTGFGENLAWNSNVSNA